MTVRTRFAPSPTGYLHIGGVRTALFNYLFAHRHGGQYLLRIDDTDKERNVEAALAPILHGFRWLDLVWDEGPEVGGPHAPYFQSQRNARYQEACDRLFAKGAAYWDYATAPEAEAERKAAEAEKRKYVSSRKWAAFTKEERAKFEAEGRKGVLRLKMPREGVLPLEDIVRGVVNFPWVEEADTVIQRADGSFIYHLANVVDDFDFGITHVVRAEEHLSNTPRQVFMIQALGYPLPTYAHLPLVAEPGSKNKLSKRKLDTYLKNPGFAKVHQHGTAIAAAMGVTTTPETFNPVIVDFYEQVGYLPDAIINYLLLLGWSLDDKTEFFTRAQMVEHFSLERVNKGAASFDPAKLDAFQAHYMKQVPLEKKIEGVLPFLAKAKISVDRSHVARVVEALGDRLRLFGDILIAGRFFFVADDQLAIDEKAFDKRVRAPGAADKLRDVRGWLAAESATDAAGIEKGLQAWLAEKGLALKDVVHSIRVAVTGSSEGPGLFDCLAVLGKERCLARIDRALAKAAA
jgi:glutamyl-tRNA synthetase